MGNSKYKSEKEFLAAYNIHDFEIPLVSVDMSIFSIIDEQLQVLLVKRAEYPHKGRWALPGGFVDFDKDKDLLDTARRKLTEKTGVETPYLEQLASFGGQDRDPRGWSVTIAYFALIAADEVTLRGGPESEDVAWAPMDSIAKKRGFAFDHKKILAASYERLRSKVTYTSLPVNLLPTEFTLGELQKTFEIILGRPIEKKSFRRRILDVNILQQTGRTKPSGTRPAMLYRVNRQGENYYFARNFEG